MPSDEIEGLLVECRGGPWDGRRIVERGQRFPVTTVLRADGSVQVHRRETGYYERCPDGCYWRSGVP